jgi:hypothetical protein
MCASWHTVLAAKGLVCLLIFGARFQPFPRFNARYAPPAHETKISVVGLTVGEFVSVRNTADDREPSVELRIWGHDSHRIRVNDPVAGEQSISTFPFADGEGVCHHTRFTCFDPKIRFPGSTPFLVSVDGGIHAYVESWAIAEVLHGVSHLCNQSGIRSVSKLGDRNREWFFDNYIAFKSQPGAIGRYEGIVGSIRSFLGRSRLHSRLFRYDLTQANTLVEVPPLDSGESSIDSGSGERTPRPDSKPPLKAILAIIVGGTVSFYVFWRMQFGEYLNWWLCVLLLMFSFVMIGYGPGLLLEGTLQIR